MVGSIADCQKWLTLTYNFMKKFGQELREWGLSHHWCQAWNFSEKECLGQPCPEDDFKPTWLYISNESIEAFQIHNVGGGWIYISLITLSCNLNNLISVNAYGDWYSPGRQKYIFGKVAYLQSHGLRTWCKQCEYLIHETKVAQIGIGKLTKLTKRCSFHKYFIGYRFLVKMPVWKQIWWRIDYFNWIIVY